MIFNNECLFFLQIIIISLFLLLFAKKKYINLLESLLIYLFIFINLMNCNEITIFSIHCSIVEPFGILMYFITIFIYNWDKQIINNFFKNIYIISIFLSLIFFIIIQYTFIKSNFILLLIHEYIFNTFISIISFNISYLIERTIFNKINFIKSPFRESLSVSIGQLFDTIFFTFLIFFNRPYTIIIEIILFSYLIKLFCILIYTFFLFYKKITDN